LPSSRAARSCWRVQCSATRRWSCFAQIHVARWCSKLQNALVQARSAHIEGAAAQSNRRRPPFFFLRQG
jgi:hypothetical protein